MVTSEMDSSEGAASSPSLSLTVKEIEEPDSLGWAEAWLCVGSMALKLGSCQHLRARLDGRSDILLA